MGDSLSILPDGGRVRVFQCPACKQTIALGCERCRFCSTAIDQQAANEAADLMDRVNLACNEAEEIRAYFSWHSAELDTEQAGGRGVEAYLIPILLLRWWVRFGALKFEDEDFLRAKSDMTRYAWYAAGLAALGLFLLALGYFRLKR